MAQEPSSNLLISAYTVGFGMHKVKKNPESLSYESYLRNLQVLEESSVHFNGPTETPGQRYHRFSALPIEEPGVASLR